jgi:hypothetical protein
VSAWRGGVGDLLRYRRTRFPAAVYLPLALFLATASLACGGPMSAGGFAGAVLLTAALVLQFRLWDDLADRERDRHAYPDRVLARADSLTPFHALLAACFILTGAWIALRDPGPRLAVFLALVGAAALWYGAPRRLRPGGVAGYHVVLCKYPAIAYLVSAPAAGGPRPLVLLLVYLCFCVYEVLHDPRLRPARGALAVLALEMSALAALPALAARDAGAAGLQATLAALGVGVLAVLFLRHVRRAAPGPWPYAVFVPGFAGLLSYSLGGPPS